MSYDLCLLPQAKQPYYIENIRTGIYSMEELCFFLYNHVCLIDESILNERLLDWLRDELGLKKLYRQLYDVLEKKEDPVFFVLPIFREAGYLDSKQMREFQEELSRLTVQPQVMRQKLRGDYLVREKLFARAAWEYRQILKRRKQGKLGNQFYAAVWNNLGAAYAGLFHFSDAADCFLQSYRLQRTKETFRKYVSALPLFLSPEEYRNRIREWNADEVLVRSIQEYNAKLCQNPEFLKYLTEQKQRPASELLEELKGRYEKATRV